MPCLASGYHTLASFHKDDNRARVPGLRSSLAPGAAHIGYWFPKLLNLLDLRTLSGFFCKQNALQFISW
jgi:hypothetical protein